MAEYFVDPVGGSNLEDGTTAGTAWATLSYASVSILGGDTLILMNTGTIMADGGVTLPNGTAAAPTKVFGANASGVIDGTRPTVHNSLGDTSELFRGDFLYIRDLITRGVNGDIFQGADLVIERVQNIIDGGIFADVNNSILIDCEYDGRSTFFAATNVRANTAIRCVSHRGFNSDSERGGNTFIDCEVRDFAGIAFSLTPSSNHNAMHSAIRCRAIRCTTGFRIGSHNTVVQGCTVVDCTGNGIELIAASGACMVENNTISGCGGYGIAINGSAPVLVERYNHFYDNTSGNMEGRPIDGTSITGDPLFTDAANDDYRPTNASPLKGASSIGDDIGAIRAADASGGGSPVTRGWAI